MGRNPKFRSPKDFRAAVDEYFASCEEKNRPPTMTGLALHLGFGSRQALQNYRNKEKFVDAVDYARARVEEYAESRLYDRDGVRGAQFNLINNFGWSGEQKIELGAMAAGAIASSSCDDMTMDEKLNYIKEFAKGFSNDD